MTGKVGAVFGSVCNPQSKEGKEKTSMSKYLSQIATLVGLSTALSMPACAATSNWQIDPQHSSAQFAVRHMAISTVRGAFSKVARTLELDDKDITKSSVEQSIEVSAGDNREPAR